LTSDLRCGIHILKIGHNGCFIPTALGEETERYARSGRAWPQELGGDRSFGIEKALEAIAGKRIEKRIDSGATRSSGRTPRLPLRTGAKAGARTLGSPFFPNRIESLELPMGEAR
jgi:hypothetical protein